MKLTTKRVDNNKVNNNSLLIKIFKVRMSLVKERVVIIKTIVNSTNTMSVFIGFVFLKNLAIITIISYFCCVNILKI
jgi:hypothetical protein